MTPDGATVSGDEEFPVNNGALCVKGWTAAELLNHPDRLLRPLKRNARGVLAPVSWDEAFKTIAEAFQATQAKHGRDAVGRSRRRLADEREGLSAGQVRARGAAHGEH